MTDKKYEQWIDDHVVEAYGNCAEITLEMETTFPELKRVRGHYNCPIWGERSHWWLITQVGTIVDPTKSQFPSSRLGDYSEWDESQSEPTGLCPNCSGYVYDGGTVCSETCHNSYLSYINNI